MNGVDDSDVVSAVVEEVLVIALPDVLSGVELVPRIKVLPFVKVFASFRPAIIKVPPSFRPAVVKVPPPFRPAIVKIVASSISG